MLKKQKVSGDAETERCLQLADHFLVLSEKELSAFISAVEMLFGAEQARQSALDWIEELEFMNWPGCDSRLASGYGGRKCSAWRFDVWQLCAKRWQPKKDILVNAASRQLGMTDPDKWELSWRECISKVSGKIREVPNRLSPL